MHREPNMLGSGGKQRNLDGPPEEPHNPAGQAIAPVAR
jgi:hypothetical protein